MSVATRRNAGPAWCMSTAFPAKSCTMLAVQAAGTNIITIEGLPAGRHPASDAGRGTSRSPVRFLHARHGDVRDRSGEQTSRRHLGAGNRDGSKAIFAAAPVITALLKRSRPRIRCRCTATHNRQNREITSWPSKASVHPVRRKEGLTFSQRQRQLHRRHQQTQPVACLCETIGPSARENQQYRHSGRGESARRDGGIHWRRHGGRQYRRPALRLANPQQGTARRWRSRRIRSSPSARLAMSAIRSP